MRLVNKERRDLSTESLLRLHDERSQRRRSMARCDIYIHTCIIIIFYKANARKDKSSVTESKIHGRLMPCC